MERTGWYRALSNRLGQMRQEAHSLLLACQDARTPWYAKFLAGLVVAYAFSPIDLIPDFIPVLGVLDDLVLVPLGVVLVRRLIPAEVMVECRARAASTSALGTPVLIAGGIIVVGIWATVAFVVYILFFTGGPA